VITNHRTNEVCTVHFQTYKRVRENYKIVTGLCPRNNNIDLIWLPIHESFSRQHFRGNSRFKWSHMLVTGRKLWRENGIHVSQKWYIHNQSQSVQKIKEAFFSVFLFYFFRFKFRSNFIMEGNTQTRDSSKVSDTATLVALYASRHEWCVLVYGFLSRFS
jgi:hypothetical protein